MRRPLTIAASPVGEHKLQTRRLSSCGSRAQLLRGMWDLPRPGLEPVSPALAGRFSTTAPPGKPSFFFLMGGTEFLSYWLVGLRLPALEFACSWVELGLGAEMRTSGRLHSDNIPWDLRFSVSPVVRTQCSHHRSSGLTPGP